MKLTLCGAFWLVLEQMWERRTRREIEGLRTPALMRRWLERLPLAHDAAASVHAWHFEAEIAMSRDFAVVALVATASLDRNVETGWKTALGLALLPLTKLVAQQLFNEVEARLPVVGRLAALREEEVVWALAARLPTPRTEAWPALGGIPVPSNLQRKAIPIRTPQACEERALACRVKRRALQRRWLAGALLVSAALLFKSSV